MAKAVRYADLRSGPGKVFYSGAETVSDETGLPIARSTRISNITRRATSTSSDIPMGEDGGPCSRAEYVALPNKDTQGLPVIAYYDPQLETGALYLWPVPDSSNVQIRFTYDRPIEDMIADTDTFDVPQEQIRRIEYGLALELAPEYALSAGEYNRLLLRYKEISEALSDFDREVADTNIMMGRR